MTPAGALEAIRALAGAWRIETSVHARDRMFERNVSYEDLQHALASARRCVEQEAGKWKVIGEDLEGVDLSAVVAIEEDLFVVTVF